MAFCSPFSCTFSIVYHTLRQYRQKTSCRAKFSATAGHKKSSGQLSPSGDFRNFSHRQFQFLRCGNLSTSRVYKMRFDLFDFLKLGKQLCRQWNFAAATDSHNQSFFHPCTIPASILTAGATQSFQKNCDRENQNHSRNHIRYRKLLDLAQSKAGRQHDKAAARLEVVDDAGIGSKIQTVVNRGTE